MLLLVIGMLCREEIVFKSKGLSTIAEWSAKFESSISDERKEAKRKAMDFILEFKREYRQYKKRHFGIHLHSQEEKEVETSYEKMHKVFDEFNSNFCNRFNLHYARYHPGDVISHKRFIMELKEIDDDDSTEAKNFLAFLDDFIIKNKN